MHLAVSVKFEDQVVEERLIVVSDSVLLGSAKGSVVSFPGGSIRVRKVVGGGLQLGNRWLRPGEPVVIERQGIVVELEAVVERRRPSVFPTLDARILVATLAFVVLTASWEETQRFFTNNPQASNQVAHLFSRDVSAEPEVKTPVAARPTLREFVTLENE